MMTPESEESESDFGFEVQEVLFDELEPDEVEYVVQVEVEDEVVVTVTFDCCCEGSGGKRSRWLEV